MKITASCLLVLLLGAVSSAWADEALMPEPAAENVEQPAEDGLLDSSTKFIATSVDDGHLRVSREVVDLGHRLDRLFGGREYDPDAAGSRLRLTLVNQIEEDGVSVEPKIRLRLALPNTERRFNLIFESEDEEDALRPGESPRPVVYSGTSSETRTSYVAGVQYIRALADYWNFDTSAGARLRAHPELFVQARLGRSFFVDLWELRLSEAAFWRRTDGLGSTTEFLAQRPLPGGPWFLRSVTLATWLHDDQQWFYSQDFSLSYEFTPLSAIQARLGVRAESQPNTQVTEYFVNIGWRRNVYKDWLFAELRPELFFDRDDDFDPDPRLFLIVEAFFGDYDWPAAQPNMPIEPPPATTEPVPSEEGLPPPSPSL